MEVTVNGKKVAVEVSASGTFYDKDTKTFNAKTLIGLQKKMREAKIPKGGIEVETTEGVRGVVIGVQKKGWQSGSFIFRPNGDGTESFKNCYYLRRIITEEEKKELERLNKEVEKADKIQEAATNTRDKYEATFEISDTLRAAFPME